MVSSILIDDEQDAIICLSQLLNLYCPDVKIIATANSVEDGVFNIREHNPDIVFLDIELHDGTGFDLLKKLPEKNFKTIFVSAFNHYAIKAIKFSAFDYLLKPVAPDELCAAVEKVKKITVNEGDQRKVLFQNLSFDNLQRLAVPIKDGFEYIRLAEIVRIQGEGSYCTFYLELGKKIMVSQNLGIYDDLLKKNNFYRTHQSHLINIAHVHRFLKTDGGTVIMSDNSTVPVSRRNKEGFNKAMQLE